MPAAKYGTVAELESSVAGACLNRTVTTIAGLSIPEFPLSKIHIRSMSWDKDLVAPFIIIRPAPETHNPSEGPVGQAVNHYREMITIASAGDRDLIEGMADALLWREKIERPFKKTKPNWANLVNGAHMRKTSVLPGEPFMNDAFYRNVNAQFLLIDVEVQEPRSA